MPSDGDKGALVDGLVQHQDCVGNPRGAVLVAPEELGRIPLHAVRRGSRDLGQGCTVKLPQCNVQRQLIYRQHHSLSACTPEYGCTAHMYVCIIESCLWLMSEL